METSLRMIRSCYLQGKDIFEVIFFMEEEEKRRVMSILDEAAQILFDNNFEYATRICGTRKMLRLLDLSLYMSQELFQKEN